METIVSIKSVKGTVVTALWSDGKLRRNDFKELLVLWEGHPVLKALCDASVFKTVSVKNGSLAWTSLKLIEDIHLGEDVMDNFFTLSPSMLYRDGIIVEEYKPQHKLASVIKKLRTAYNMTQEQLALKVGVSKTYISKIERGVTDINYGTYEWILELGFNKTLVVADLVERDNWVSVEQKPNTTQSA